MAVSTILSLARDEVMRRPLARPDVPQPKGNFHRTSCRMHDSDKQRASIHQTTHASSRRGLEPGLPLVPPSHPIPSHLIISPTHTLCSPLGRTWLRGLGINNFAHRFPGRA